MKIKSKSLAATGVASALSLVVTSALAIDGTYSGNWWEGEAKSGRGFLLEVTPIGGQDNLIVNWFTYDNNGNQIWITGGAPVTAGSETIEVPLQRLEGGSFGPEFQASDATRSNWGSITFNFDSCASATANYSGSDGSGNLNLTALTHPSGLTCNATPNTGTPFTGCPAFSTAVSGADATCGIPAGTITSDITLTSNTTWVLQGGVFIGDDNANSATLTIKPGTKIVGRAQADFLFIRRGSTINAIGTAANPIVMTGPNEQIPGEWGGLVIAGNSTVNGCATPPCELTDEALGEPYGGSNETDSSGTLRYVQINYAGFPVQPNRELNGLTLLGVGSGTDIEFVQVHRGQDDGIEMFGGTVNLKHVVMTGIEDDSLDWGFGWRGNTQYVYINQAGADAPDNGIEADSNEDNFDLEPRALVAIANMTSIGTALSNEGARFRRGTGAQVFNSIIAGYGAECLNIDDDSTFSNGGGSVASLNGNLIIQNSYVNCTTNFDDKTDDLFLVSDWFTSQIGNVAGDPQLNGFLPAAGSPVTNSGGSISVGAGFFESTSYSGAFRDANDNWTAGWTTGL